MAKLKCEHERRALVFKKANREVVIMHRNDGTKCDKRYVSLLTLIFNPHAHSATGPAPTDMNALGPFLTIGTAEDARVIDAKRAKQTKKVKRVKR